MTTTSTYSKKQWNSYIELSLRDLTRNKKKNKMETLYQWKSLSNLMELLTNNNKRISNDFEKTQKNMNRENGQLQNELIQNYTKKSADTRLTRLKQLQRFTKSVKQRDFKPKLLLRSMKNYNMSYNIQPTRKKLETLYKSQQSKSKRLAIFGFTQTKNQERIAKIYAINALSLPPSIRHHVPKKENHKTTNAFSDEFLDILYQARWERDIITKQSSGHFQHSNRGRGNGYSRGNRGNSRSFRGGFRGGRSSFFWTTPRWDLHPFDIQQPTQQLPQQSQPKQRLISTVDSNLQRTTKTIIPIDKQHYNIPSDGIKPGGRLQRFYQQWKKITSHRWPLSVVQEGYKIQFNKTPQPWKIRPLHLNQIEQQAVLKFLKTDIIEISPDQNTDYLSNFFTIQEPNKRRPILDCQKINQFIQCHHFKMEGVPALRELMEKNDYMCKLDLKDAYVVVGLHPQSRKYLTFMNQGIVYQYKTLAFGMSVSPRVFSKIMRFAMESLRKEGVPRLSIQFHNHEDHSAYDKNQQIDQPNKTGFITTDENLQMRDLARSLQIHQQKWEAPFNLSSHSITELQWWINLVSSKNGLPIQRIENEQPAITIHVDASDIAWGVASPELETMGYWTNEEKGHSINVRELSAILFAIQLHAKKYKNSSGTSSPLLQDLAVKIQDICNQYKLKVEYHHIPGVNNIQADQLSRQRMESPLCIRVETKSPITSVLEPQTRSRSHSIGCLQSAVDNERDVLIPTLEIHSPDKHPVEKTED
ncbi:hypothetical protein G6F62_006542 [Rhizopus arrhizus]|nr:hypothetical protein G6F62_006542 [Rhizopus arrhizus]